MNAVWIPGAVEDMVLNIAVGILIIIFVCKAMTE